MVRMASAAILAFCSSLQVAHLSTSLTCRASFPVAPQGKVCFSEDLWKRWLDERRQGLVCANLEGTWSAHRAPLNDFSRKLNPETPAKSSEFLFQIKSWAPQVSHPDEVMTQAYLRPLLALEKLRLEVSDALQDSDTTGIFRSLLLGESAETDSSGVLRMLGFCARTHGERDSSFFALCFFRRAA